MGGDDPPRNVQTVVNSLTGPLYVEWIDYDTHCVLCQTNRPGLVKAGEHEKVNARRRSKVCASTL